MGPAQRIGCRAQCLLEFVDRSGLHRPIQPWLQPPVFRERLPQGLGGTASRRRDAGTGQHPIEFLHGRLVAPLAGLQQPEVEPRLRELGLLLQGPFKVAFGLVPGFHARQAAADVIERHRVLRARLFDLAVRGQGLLPLAGFPRGFGPQRGGGRARRRQSGVLPRPVGQPLQGRGDAALAPVHAGGQQPGVDALGAGLDRLFEGVVQFRARRLPRQQLCERQPRGSVAGLAPQVITQVPGLSRFVARIARKMWMSQGPHRRGITKRCGCPTERTS